MAGSDGSAACMYMPTSAHGSPMGSTIAAAVNAPTAAVRGVDAEKRA